MRPALIRARARLSALSGDSRTILRNFVSLSVLQAANYMLPLLTVPYLLRVVGPGGYGSIGLATAVVQYLVTLTEYGFNLSATRDVATHRHDMQAVSRIYSAVLAVKVILGTASLGCLLVLLAVVGRYRADAIIYLLAFGAVPASILFPIWLFQGMEQMHFITILNLVARVLYLVAVFVWIRGTADYVYVPLLNSIVGVLCGAVSLVVAHRRLGVRLVRVSFGDVAEQLRAGWAVFVSSVAVSLYAQSTIVILGFFASNLVVGYFTAADRLVRAARGLLLPISQSIYPHVSKLAAQSREVAMRFIRRTTVLVGAVGLLLSLAVLVAAAPLVQVVLGPECGPSLPLVRILSPLPFIIGVANMATVQTMLAFGHDRQLYRLLIAAAIVSVVLSVAIVPRHQAIGSAVVSLLTEAFVMVAALAYTHRAGLSLLQLHRLVPAARGSTPLDGC